jgi:serine/threonine protein kinase
MGGGSVLETKQILEKRYQLDQKLGQNAGRKTWRSLDLETGEQVIVKLLTFSVDVQWDDLKLFEREAQILQQLDHPCIPKYRDYFAIDNKALWFGLVQDYIPGNSLKDLLQQGIRFSEEEVQQIAIEILEILIYLHELNPPVLHRDIKPSNIIYGEDEQVYLVDFGAVQDKASAEGKTFTVVGTYGYAPIEQFGGRAVPASDLYALGATLIHLLTGVSPADLPQDDLKIEFRDRTSASASFLNWIDRLTAASLKKRPQSAKKALKLLKGKLEEENLPIANLPMSRVQIKEKDDELVIKILPKTIKSYNDLMVYGLVAVIAACFMGIILYISIYATLDNSEGFIIGGPIFLFFLMMASAFFGTIAEELMVERLQLSHDTFILQEEYLGFKLRINQEDEQILAVGQNLGSKPEFAHLFEDTEQRGILYLVTETKRYAFGKGLPSRELEQLEREIKDFLGIIDNSE